MKHTPENIEKLEPHQIFCFGSNLAGIHGAGAALLAKQKFGAIQGVGVGFTGDCYAIPTKDSNIKTLALKVIFEHIKTFYFNAVQMPEFEFLMTKVGCGLAGYSTREIGDLFRNFAKLSNVVLPEEFV